MHGAPPLHLADYVGPPVAAMLFVVLMSLVKEPGRRNFNGVGQPASPERLRSERRCPLPCPAGVYISAATAL
jgi:hypothetical protein